MPDAGDFADLARPDLPKPSCRVILVCGAPASGKSTYVQEHKRGSDIVIDLDTIAREHGLGRDRDNSSTSALLEARNKRLAALSLEAKNRTAWVIITAPSRSLRAWWCHVLGVVRTDLILLAPPRHELRRRIMLDPDRTGVRQLHFALVDQWLQRERANDPGITKRGVDDDGCPTDPLHAWNRKQKGEHDRRYGLQRWRRRARQQLREHPLCVMCLSQGQVVPASVADHVKPHRGDESLFWFGELQSLCQLCHNVTKQRQEIDGYASVIDDDGWPTDPTHPSNKAQRG
jgi:5-methylcytosine-specific restriction enzyme A